ncbi:ferritin family protein [Thermococcus sp.]|uniref:ferritin family protein n=1 Tax=Thermococcus sp. TaxID=35749 RepID=UPI002609FF78|nr:ferritin family protein [Thermococcus sp.]
MPHLSPELKRYMERVIETLRDRPVKEILSYAIFNERDEVEYYRKLAEHAGRESIKILFIQMADESQEHHDRLYSLFKKLYSDEEPVKVDAPPIEVAPFYPEFETVDDYLGALGYCMQSELFAQQTYELLSQKATREDSRVLFAQLADMEKNHYERLKKAYDLLAGFNARKMLPEDVSPGGYLFPDRIKARYMLLDLMGKGLKPYVFSRDPSKRLFDWFKRDDINAVWVSSAPVKGVVTPGSLISSKTDLVDLLESENAVLLIENFETIVVSGGFVRAFDMVSILRDVAIVSGSYLLVHAKENALPEREWAILESELEVID